MQQQPRDRGERQGYKPRPSGCRGEDDRERAYRGGRGDREQGDRYGRGHGWGGGGSSGHARASRREGPRVPMPHSPRYGAAGRAVQEQQPHALKSLGTPPRGTPQLHHPPPGDAGSSAQQPTVWKQVTPAPSTAPSNGAVCTATRAAATPVGLAPAPAGPRPSSWAALLQPQQPQPQHGPAESASSAARAAASDAAATAAAAEGAALATPAAVAKVPSQEQVLGPARELPGMARAEQQQQPLQAGDGNGPPQPSPAASAAVRAPAPDATPPTSQQPLHKPAMAVPIDAAPAPAQQPISAAPAASATFSAPVQLKPTAPANKPPATAAPVASSTPLSWADRVKKQQMQPLRPMAAAEAKAPEVVAPAPEKQEELQEQLQQQEQAAQQPAAASVPAAGASAAGPPAELQSAAAAAEALAAAGTGVIAAQQEQQLPLPQQPQEQHERQELQAAIPAPAAAFPEAQEAAAGPADLSPPDVPVALLIPLPGGVPVPGPPMLVGAMQPPPPGAFFLAPHGAMPPMMPSEASGPPFMPLPPGMPVPPHPMGVPHPPGPRTELGMPSAVPHGAMLQHPGIMPLPHHPHHHAWGRGVPVQAYHMHPAVPPPGPSPPLHPGRVPHMPPHPPGAPLPVWGHLPPMQQQPLQRLSFGRGVPVSPRREPPLSLGIWQDSAGSGAGGSPLNPNSAVFRPTGRASSPLLLSHRPPSTALAGADPIAAAEPPQQQSAALEAALEAGSGSSSSTSEVPASEKPQQPSVQEQPQQLAAAEAPAAVQAAAAESVPVQQPPAESAPVQVVAAVLEPKAEAQAVTPDQHQQSAVSSEAVLEPQESAAGPGAAQTGAEAGTVVLGGNVVSEEAAAGFAAPTAQTPATPKSWAALAASQTTSTAVQFRPHTTPQRTPGHAPPPSLQQQHRQHAQQLTHRQHLQQQQQQHPGPGGRGERGHPGGRDGAHAGKGKGAGYSHSGSRDGMLPHHQQRNISSSHSSSGGTPNATRAAVVSASAATAPAAANSLEPGTVPGSGWPLAEMLPPMSRGAAAACAAAGAVEARVQPRGLLNPGNLCFMNSILQALLGSSRFCQLLGTLCRAAPQLDAASTPTLAALAELAAEFPPMEQPAGQQMAQQEQDGTERGQQEAAATGAAKATALHMLLLGGQPLMPVMLMEVVNSFHPLGSGNGDGAASSIVMLGPGKSNGGSAPPSLQPRWEQEDAHDFLEYLVDRMHQEWARLGSGGGGGAVLSPTSAAAAANAAKGAEEDEWLTRSGRRTTKRQPLKVDSESAVSDLFRGTTLSTVTCQGHPPSETPQPFVSLTLHILSGSVRSVDDALDLLTTSERISGYRPQDHSAPIDADKAVRLQRLPPLLVLFLMRFDPANLRQKISKAVAFPLRLKMKRAWLAVDSGERGGGAPEYELVSTVTHHGKTIGSGHYTADVHQLGDKWLRFDDGNVTFVSQQAVLTSRPYLLLYQRMHPQQL